MNTKVNKAYFLIPVVYAAAIIFLLYMQFSGSRSFQADVMDISMSGKTHSGAPGKDEVISDLTIKINDIEFFIRSRQPSSGVFSRWARP